MDVCVVLTHRCNLDCRYCCAGEHDRRDMDGATLDAAVDLLDADGAAEAQLSFFGGEPFIRFDAMKRAVERAQRAAAARGARLLLQCTTNGTLVGDEQVAFVRASGMRVTVSIDGVREAHDLNRPRAGGGSSFAASHRGLRALVNGGARPDVLMVVSPQTAPYLHRSVAWLWGQGVDQVGANLVLDAPWDASDRAELAEQLWAVGTEMLARRLGGERAGFDPFMPGYRRALRAQSRDSGSRPQIIVATGGNLYPCALMVGEDRDAGREASVRLGHLSNGSRRITERVGERGAGCGDGRSCACAAYLETGERDTPGPVARWYARICDEVGWSSGAAHRHQMLRDSRGPRKRPLVIWLAAAAGLLALGAAPVLAALEDAPSADDRFDEASFDDPRHRTMGKYETVQPRRRR